ncbi:MAG TPA: ABC transporter substrate-binding protein, partial [Ramlibacter sp.]|nr:ABC transporter substrate-binding protein [Ramlibacter sp.]
MKKPEPVQAARLVTRRKAAAGIAAVVAAGMTPLARAQAAKEPVLVGVAVPTTMSFGQQNIRGIDLAVKQVNAAGGVWGGRPLKTVVYDDQNKPEEGVSAVERLITRDKVVALIGSVGTAVTAAQLTVTRRYRKVHFAHSA